jgi:hypothetical protein
MPVARSIRLTIAALILLILCPSSAAAYSLLAHEALIDGAWSATIEPLLRQRFPNASRDDLVVARTYAYGGSAVQDIGYYPFGNRFVSDLLHYTRSGDFIEYLLRDARDLNEYAFAVGALAHYVGDTVGHSEAINRAVPILFPKLRRKYGSRVLYEQAPAQHVVTEFSFDVVETAAGHYGPEAYTRFIGFSVPKPLLERAFRDTYGLELEDLFGDVDLAVGTYRFSVSQLIPAVTGAAWRDKRDEIARLIPRVDERIFVYTFSTADYEQRYGRIYRRPGWFARFLGALYRLLPKIGPLKPLRFTTPTPDAQHLFTDSLADARVRYRALLEDVRAGRLRLPNADFDTAESARHGAYRLADKTYASLVHRLASSRFATVSPALKRDVLAYYAGTAPLDDGDGRRSSRDRRLERELAQLEAASPSRF